MMKHFRKIPKILAAMLILALMTPWLPSALAESFSAFVKSHSMTVYAESSLSNRIGSLGQYTVVTVTRHGGGVAEITLNGRTGYARVSDMTRVDQVAESVAVNEDGRVYQSPSTSAKSVKISKGTKVNVILVHENWALVERGGVGGYMQTDALFASSATPEPTAAPDLSNAIPAVANKNVKVYPSANTSTKPLGTLKKGVPVNVVKASGGWAYIEMSGRYGYCALSALTPVSSVTPEPTPTPDLSQAIPAVANKNVKVYPSANTSTKPLGTLKKGVPVNVVKASGGWAYIEMSGRYGYCALSALTPVSSVTPEPTPTPDLSQAIPAVANKNVKVYASANTSSEYLGTLKKGVPVNVIKTSGGWAYIEMGGRYGFCALSALNPVSSVTPEPTPTPDLSNAIPAVANKTVKVYAAANTSSEFLGNLKKGVEVNILKTSDGWAYIEMNGRYGFCALSALSPKTEPTATPDPSKFIPAVVKVSAVMVYSKASTSSEELGWIKKGAKVNVIQINGDWAWIEMNGRYGYCAVAALSPLEEEDPLDGFVKETFSATVVVNGAKLYEGLKDGASSVNLNMGTDVTVGAYSPEWAYVKVNGAAGFVKVSALSKSAFSPLASGDSSSAVSTLEKALLSMGYFDCVPDNTYDAYTENAVRMFQSALGMSADGKASQGLQRVLYSGNGPACGLLSASYASGASGNNVSRIQLRLFSLGYLSKAASVDGNYGSTTANAITLFQKANGIGQTGKADSATLRKLYSTGANPLPSGVNPADKSGVVSPNGSGQANNSTQMAEGLKSHTSSLSPGMSMAEKLEYAIYVGQNQLGKPYVYGANGTSSYDCTGFTCYCMRQIGISLKRTAVNQGYDDTYTKISGISGLKRGDLVFFNTVSDNDLSDHAGIYLGAGYFIHASSGQGKVVVSTLNSGYYNRVFSWGRRVY